MPDDRLPWFPCYPTKLLGALAGMKPSEGYVYWIVCLRIYEVGGPCRDSLDAISRRTGFNRRVVSDALDACFRTGKLIRDGDGIINPFAAEVMADSRTLLEKRKSAGSAGGKRTAEKYKQDQGNPPSKATASPQQSPRHVQETGTGYLFPDGNKPAKAKAAKPPTDLEIARKELFDRGKQVLGDGAGGMIQKLLAAKHGNIPLARAAIEQASTMDDAKQYIGAIVRGGVNGKAANAGGRVGFSGIAAGIRAKRAGAIDDDPARPAPEDLQPINGR